MQSMSLILCYCLLCLAVAWSDPAAAQDDVSGAGKTVEPLATKTVNPARTDSGTTNNAPPQTDNARSGRSDDSPLAASGTSIDPEAMPVLAVPTEEFRQAVESEEYVLFPRAKLHQLSRRGGRRTDDSLPLSPTIAQARYTATLSGDSLSDGLLEYQLNAPGASDSYVLGRTNLRELKFHLDGNLVPFAALPDGRADSG